MKVLVIFRKTKYSKEYAPAFAEPTITDAMRMIKICHRSDPDSQFRAVECEFDPDDAFGIVAIGAKYDVGTIEADGLGLPTGAGA